MKTVILKPSSYYHFYNRGNNKENLFREQTNYLHFINLLQKHLLPVCEVYSYCLLPNHFHMVIQIKDMEQLPEKYRSGERRIHQPFSNMLNAYTKAYNKKYNRTGSLFQKHPKKIEITDEDYFKNLIVYINTNSSHHGIGDYEAYPYSSYHQLISEAPTFLKREVVIEAFDGKENLEYVLKMRSFKI